MRMWSPEWVKWFNENSNLMNHYARVELKNGEHFRGVIKGINKTTLVGWSLIVLRGGESYSIHHTEVSGMYWEKDPNGEHQQVLDQCVQG